MNQDIITLDYGSGGRKTAQLIDELLLPAFQSDTLNALGDGAVLDLSGPLVFSTDSFVVSPLFFPGGDIGKLSVCGTVNDLAMCGGIPRYLSLSFIIEEGLAVEELKCIISSIARTARAAGVEIVTGDTKVVERHRHTDLSRPFFRQYPGGGRSSHLRLHRRPRSHGDDGTKRASGRESPLFRLSASS